MANFPLTLDTQDSLYNVADLAQDSLAADLNAGVTTTFDLVDGSEFPTGRQIVSVNAEIIIVASRAGNTFTIETRGAFGTTDANHLTSDIVAGNYTAGHYEVIRDTILDMQQNLQWYRQPVLDSQVADPGTLAVPTVGDRYAIPGLNNAAPGIGAWAGNLGDIAIFNGSDVVTYGTNAGAWDFIDAQPGTLAFAHEVVTTGGTNPRLAIQVFDSWFGLNDIPASQISYANGVSGLAATNVQDAIDEVAAFGIDDILSVGQVLTAGRSMDMGAFSFAITGSLATFTSNSIWSPGIITHNVTDSGAGVTTLINVDGTNASLQASGTNLNSVDVSESAIELTIGAASELSINSNPGTAGQVITSQGPGLPPVWGAAGGASGIDDVLAVGQVLTADRLIAGGGNRLDIQTSDAGGNTQFNIDTTFARLLSTGVGTTSNLVVNTTGLTTAFTDGTVGVNSAMNATNILFTFDDGVTDISSLELSAARARLGNDTGGDLHYVEATNLGLNMNFDVGDLRVNGAAGASGEVLTSQGPGAPPQWGFVSVPTPGIDDVLAVGQVLTTNRTIDANGNSLFINSASGPTNLTASFAVGNFSVLTQNAISQGLVACSPGSAQVTADFGGNTVGILAFNGGIDVILDQGAIFIDGVAGNVGEFLQSQGNSAAPIWSTVPADGIDDVLAVGQVLTAARTIDANQNSLQIDNNNGAGSTTRFNSAPTFVSLEGSDGVTNSTVSVGGPTCAMASVGTEVNVFVMNQGGVGFTFGAASDLDIQGVPGAVGEALISNGAGVPPQWGTPARPVFQSLNTNTATNLNTAGVTQIPIMGNVTHAGPAGMFTVGGNLVTVNVDAVIKVSWNINNETTGTRVNLGTRVLLNGASVGPRGGSGYIRNSAGHNEASTHGSHVLTVSTGDTIGIGTQRLGTATTATTMAVAGLSNIIIEVLELT